MAVNNETLGQVVKRKRLKLGMTLRDLAGKVNVSHVTIMKIENDKFKVVDPAIVAGIADALHLDRLFLLSLQGAGVADNRVRIIARVIAKLSREEGDRMLKMDRDAFPEAFAKAESDDLDENC